MKLSKETKKKISESMKKAHSEGRHPGWYHINSSKIEEVHQKEFFINS